MYDVRVNYNLTTPIFLYIKYQGIYSKKLSIAVTL